MRNTLRSTEKNTRSTTTNVTCVDELLRPPPPFIYEGRTAAIAQDDPAGPGTKQDMAVGAACHSAVGGKRVIRLARTRFCLGSYVCALR